MTLFGPNVPESSSYYYWRSHPSGTYGRFDSARGAALSRADSGAW